MNANQRNRIMAGAILFCGLLMATPASAGPNVDAGAMWLRGEELQLAQAGQIDASVEISSEPDVDRDAPALERDLRIQVWHGREDDDPYGKGESLDLRFRSNADAYVVVYRIDADGYVEVLWPNTRYDDGFAYGGHSYRLPPADSGRRLHVSNKKGVEYIQAMASEYPFDLRDLGIDFAFDPEERGNHDYVVAGDPFLAVNEINYAITGLEEDEDYIVTDWTHLYVESKVDYARYSCNQCHTDDDDHHAYVDTCSQVSIRYDFGWYDRWYLRYGWYPVYYDPLYVYWDSYYYRPYYNWYYPVYYSWPSYYSSVYYRPYRVYNWWDTDYYRGDHRRFYRDRVTRSRPLYPDRGGSIKDRIRDSIRRDTDPNTRRIARGTGDRARDAVPNVRSRIRTARADQRRELLNTERSTRRTDRLRRDLSNRDRGRGRDRIVSQSPDGKSRQRQTRLEAGDRRGRDGRRWTKPVVRNTDRNDERGRVLRSRERNDDRKRTLQSRGRSDDRRRVLRSRDTDRSDDRSDDRKRTLRSRGRSDDRKRERPTVRSRSKDTRRRDDKDRGRSIRRSDRRGSSRDDDRPAPRVKSRERKPAQRKDSKASPRVKSRRGRGGDDKGKGSARVSRGSQRSPRPSRGATVKRSAPRTRSGKSPAQRSSGSRSSVRSRDTSSSKSSASKSSSGRRSGSSRSSRGGRGRG